MFTTTIINVPTSRFIRKICCSTGISFICWLIYPCPKSWSPEERGALIRKPESHQVCKWQAHAGNINTALGRMSKQDPIIHLAMPITILHIYTFMGEQVGTLVYIKYICLYICLHLWGLGTWVPAIKAYICGKRNMQGSYMCEGSLYIIQLHVHGEQVRQVDRYAQLSEVLKESVFPNTFSVLHSENLHFWFIA